MTINKYCPKCRHVLVTELQINDKTMESRLHEYCEQCGFDIDVDPFGTFYREHMKQFCFVSSKKQKTFDSIGVKEEKE